MSLTHLNEHGDANMVDVSDKAVSTRQALAEGFVEMRSETLDLIVDGQLPKGDVFSVARIAGIQGVKQCANLIPLCHPLALSKVWIDFEPEPEHQRIRIICGCRLNGQTGVEMEALTGVCIAALTLFDMCKAVDPAMRIGTVRVLEKRGGKSGEWHCDH